MIELKTEREIQIIKSNGRILAKTLKLLEQTIGPGIKTKDLDRLSEDFIKREGGHPAFKGYRGFPSSVCVSIDEEVVHGIPGERIIEVDRLWRMPFIPHGREGMFRTYHTPYNRLGRRMGSRW
jgi:methionyl aminopeptidase